MTRRDFFKLITSGIVAYELDIDKLLWVPGEKKIFIPPARLTTSQIIALELERVLPKFRDLFDRDLMFYAMLAKPNLTVEFKGSEMKLPLIVDPKRFS